MTKKVMIISGSQRIKANCDCIAEFMEQEIRKAGHEAEIFTIRDRKITPCLACNSCKQTDICITKDDASAMYTRLLEYDAILFVSPIYFGNVPGTVKTLIDRLYFLFNPSKPPRETKSKKMGVTLSFGNGPATEYEKVAQQIGGFFGLAGVKDHKVVLCGSCNDPHGFVSNSAYQEEVRKLVEWLVD